MAARRCTRTSSRATTRSTRACLSRSTCWSRKSVRSVLISTWRGTNESAARTLQAGSAGRRLRLDQDRARVAREDPLVVLRRGEEAGDDQLPHVQARARWSLLRQDLRADQGLRVPLREVQAPEAPRSDM